MRNNEKTYERVESEEVKKTKIIQWQKEICKDLFIYVVRKKSKFSTPNPLFPSIHKHPILVEAHSTLRRPYVAFNPSPLPSWVILEFSSKTLTMRSS